MLVERLDTTSWVDVVVGAAPDAGDAQRAIADSIESAGVGATPIAVVVLGSVAEAVLRVVSLDPNVVGVALVGAALSADCVDLLAAWDVVPVVVVVDSARPDTLPGAVSTYQRSTHPDGALEIVGELDVGNEMFGSRADSWGAALDTVVGRLRRTLTSSATRSEISFVTEDGWEIYGTLSVPRRPAPVPAAVLLHSGRSDRAVFTRLERLLTRRGVAVANIDWRGRGMSQNRATYFELSREERAEGWRDAAATVDALAGHRGVDADRVAMIGVVHGAEHAVACSIADPRVRMLALLTGYVPRTDDERAHLVSGDVEVLYVTCEGHDHVSAEMESLVAETPRGQATILTYPGGAIGYQLFDIDPSLEDLLARWVATGLGADQGGES